jgi:hypothetical protein
MEDKMERKAQEETRTNSEGTLKVAKKSYVSPHLTEYGNVEKLTQRGGRSGTDARLMMGCL